jgi:hypothetical protein
MKTKCLSAILTAGAMTVATTSVANSAETPQLNFTCEVSQGVPTTVAQYAGDDTKLPIFHWKDEVLASRSTSSPQQLCNMVSEKLESYSAQGYDLSKLSFVGTAEGRLPVICANTAGVPECSKVLLTLAPAQQADIVADKVVSGILDKDLPHQKEIVGTNERGVQSFAYQVDFWSLLGLNLKYIGK